MVLHALEMSSVSHVLALRSFASRPRRRPVHLRERVKTSGCVNATEGLPAGSVYSGPRQAPAPNDLPWLTQTRDFFNFFLQICSIYLFIYFTETNWVHGPSPVVWSRTPAWASRKSISPCFQFDGLQTAGWFSKIKQASRSHPVKPFTHWPADLSIFSIRVTQGEYKYPDSGKFIEVNDVRHWCNGEDCGFDSSRKWPGPHQSAHQVFSQLLFMGDPLLSCPFLAD